MLFQITPITLLAGSALMVAVAGAQQPTHATQVTIDPKLAAQAKITKDSAQHIALRVVPHATVRSAELEREHGKLIYSFDLKVAGKSGIEEVNINALDGSVVAVEHESPKAERREAMHEDRGH
jgi:uncharacterized membrane protein YkoI